jgi:hypothetical protein
MIRQGLFAEREHVESVDFRLLFAIEFLYPTRWNEQPRFEQTASQGETVPGDGGRLDILPPRSFRGSPPELVAEADGSLWWLEIEQRARAFWSEPDVGLAVLDDSHLPPEPTDISRPQSPATLVPSA